MTPSELADRWEAEAADCERTALDANLHTACVLRSCVAELRTALRAAPEGWRPLSEMPDTLVEGERLTVWGKNVQRGCPQPWPGGGWALTICGSEFYHKPTGEYLAEDGYTHWCRLPYLEPPR